MDQITVEQLNTLSQQFTAMGNAIVDYRSDHAELTEDEDSRLEQLEDSLFDKASELATLSAIEAGNQAASAINSLTQVNTQITLTIQTLKEVQKVIDIATAAVKVAVSVISMNPGQIVSSVGGLATACGINI